MRRTAEQSWTIDRKNIARSKKREVRPGQGTSGANQFLRLAQVMQTLAKIFCIRFSSEDYTYDRFVPRFRTAKATEEGTPAA